MSRCPSEVSIIINSGAVANVFMIVILVSFECIISKPIERNKASKSKQQYLLAS